MSGVTFPQYDSTSPKLSRSRDRDGRFQPKGRARENRPSSGLWLGQPQDTRGGHKRRVAWLWASIMRAPNSFPLRTFSKGNEHHTKCKRPRAARNRVVSGETHVPLERPRRRRNTSKRKCSTAKASGKCSLQSRDEPWAAPSARVWPNSVDYTPNPELVQCSGVEMGFVSFVWPRSMRDLSSPTNTNGTCAPCSGSAWEVQVGFL